MTPEQIAAAGTEHSHQAAFFCALRDHYVKYPQLRFMHAIPNGGERNVVVASKLKAEGVKQGVPDTFLPYPSGAHHGLYIEFKRPKSNGKAEGKLSKEQETWADYLIFQKFAYFVAYDYLQAIKFVLEYMSLSQV